MNNTPDLPPHNYVTAVYSSLIEPLAALYQQMETRRGIAAPNDVQAAPSENGYAIAIIALAAFLVEGACNRARYVVGQRGKSSASNTLRAFQQHSIADRLDEVFVVRDVVAHGHIWIANVVMDAGGLTHAGPPTLLPGYGDERFRQLVDIPSRTTRKLKLDVFPSRIHKGTATAVLKECAAALRYLESRDRRFVYLQPISVRLGDNEFKPFYSWIDDL